MRETGKPRAARPRIHPWPLRLMHWINAVAIVTMIGSGWQIYDASPLFGFLFPRVLTIGQWLGAGIAWHLAAMWLLVLNGIAYVLWGAASGHFREKLLPLRFKALARDFRLALRLRLPHETGVYNTIQRASYIGVLLLGVVIVLSGLAIWKPIQLWYLSDLLGGYVVSRYIHFAAMAGIVAFVVLHLALVMLVPKTLPPMITGGRQPERPGREAAREARSTR